MRHQCKAEYCMKRVYFDHTLKDHFSYCSPSCRDKDLFHGDQYQFELASEIFALEETLKTMEPVYISEPERQSERGML